MLKFVPVRLNVEKILWETLNSFKVFFILLSNFSLTHQPSKPSRAGKSTSFSLLRLPRHRLIQCNNMLTYPKASNGEQTKQKRTTTELLSLLQWNYLNPNNMRLPHDFLEYTLAGATTEQNIAPVMNEWRRNMCTH